MENKNNSSEILLKALEDFKSQYPMSTSGDLQTFIIGWNKAVEILSLNDNTNNLLNYTIDNNTYNASGEKEYPIYTTDDEKLFLELISKLRMVGETNCDVWYDKDNCGVIVKEFDNKIVYFSINIFCSKFELYRKNKPSFKIFLKDMIMEHLRCDEDYKIDTSRIY